MEWDYAAVPLGKLEVPSKQSEKGVEYGVHEVQPLIETRAPFELDIWELDNIVRGKKDIDFSTVENAAQHTARFEENAVYYGFNEAGIKGLKKSSPYDTISLSGQDENFLDSVSLGITRLLEASVEGPFGMAVSPDIWRYLSGYVRGYPLRNHLEKLLGGPVILGPYLGEAFLVSMRGGDVQLVIGQDISIGYQSHDHKKVKLYFTDKTSYSP
jgi:uncharacterized linocin/CFP29 family protein